MNAMVKDFADEYERWRILGEKAIAQTPDDALNRVPTPDGNSVAVIVRHVGGNLASRFTDFLTSDGEKPWRERDAEFETRDYTRAEVEAAWARGWDVLEATLAALGDDDLARTVQIRGASMTVHAALCRSLAHICNHVGQLILLGRVYATEWQTLSIPRGGSQAYNQNPTLEKRPH
jgi:hypothetical protein